MKNANPEIIKITIKDLRNRSVSKADESLPMVFGPSGYAVISRSGQELSGILQCNLLTVTHRFFQGARPDPVNREYLTIEQAAADHHHIVSLLKDIYKGPWISSGASKSGQTVLFHKRFWPDDIDATVAYVDFYEPYVYQALTETGYPAYATEHISDLLLNATNPGAEFYLTENISTTYNPLPIEDITDWLKSEGNNIIYIYGGVDPWSAAMFEPVSGTNAIRIIQPGADHSVRIANLDEKDMVIETLEDWLNINIDY